MNKIKYDILEVNEFKDKREKSPKLKNWTQYSIFEIWGSLVVSYIFNFSKTRINNWNF